MKKLKLIKIKIVSLCLVLLSVTGCVWVQEAVYVPYQGRANLTVVDGAENINFEIAAVDRRTIYKDRVGVKKGGSGIEISDITAKNDIAKTFADAVGFELENLGFRPGVGGKKVKVELIRFYADFKMGVFLEDVVGDGIITVLVLNQSEEVMYSRSYEGGSVVGGAYYGSAAGPREALIKTMADIVIKVAHDKDLHKAMLK